MTRRQRQNETITVVSVQQSPFAANAMTSRLTQFAYDFTRIDE
jgi:hypothetical protein